MHAGIAAPATSWPSPLGPAPPARVQDPVCTPKGFLFSREAILENLLEQKKANKRKLAAWEAQQADEARKQASRPPQRRGRAHPPASIRALLPSAAGGTTRGAWVRHGAQAGVGSVAPTGGVTSRPVATSSCRAGPLQPGFAARMPA